MFTDLRHDVLYGLRVLAKSPGFTAVAALTLALCIGANTAIFSIINAVMLKSLPVRDPQHLMLFEWSARVSPKIHSSSSYGDCNSSFGDATRTVARYRSRFSKRCESWVCFPGWRSSRVVDIRRSEEHTSELQSLRHLVCRLLLEK